MTLALTLLVVIRTNANILPLNREVCTPDIAYINAYQVSRTLLQANSASVGIHPTNLRQLTSDTSSGTSQPRCSNAPVQPTIQPHRNGLCPWEYVPDHDANRIPQTIYKARCLTCTGNCLSPSSRATGQYEDGDEVTSRFMGCKEIHHSFSVLKKQSCLGGTGLVEYREEDITIPVGCACTRLQS